VTELDRKSIEAAIDRANGQPRADATIDQLSLVVPLTTDEIPLFRSSLVPGVIGPTYKTTLGALAALSSSTTGSSPVTLPFDLAQVGNTPPSNNTYIVRRFPITRQIQVSQVGVVFGAGGPFYINIVVGEIAENGVAPNASIAAAGNQMFTLDSGQLCVTPGQDTRSDFRGCSSSRMSTGALPIAATSLRLRSLRSPIEKLS
jgi:hypothetical protein